jgi:hypothetical protein
MAADAAVVLILLLLLVIVEDDEYPLDGSVYIWQNRRTGETCYSFAVVSASTSLLVVLSASRTLYHRQYIVGANAAAVDGYDRRCSDGCFDDLLLRKINELEVASYVSTCSIGRSGAPATLCLRSLFSLFLDIEHTEQARERALSTATSAGQPGEPNPTVRFTAIAAVRVPMEWQRKKTEPSIVQARRAARMHWQKTRKCISLWTILL